MKSFSILFFVERIGQVLGLAAVSAHSRSASLDVKTSVLMIDGENFKKSIASIFIAAGKQKPLWHHYDFRGLLDRTLGGFPADNRVFYTARILNHPDTPLKSRELIEEQRLLNKHLKKSGFDVVIGGSVRGQLNAERELVFREKGVDVSIAVDMVSAAHCGNVSRIILASSDSDLEPAIKEIRRRGVECVYLGFQAAPNRGMIGTADQAILIPNADILSFGKPGSPFDMLP